MVVDVKHTAFRADLGWNYYNEKGVSVTVSLFFFNGSGRQLT